MDDFSVDNGHPHRQIADLTRGHAKKIAIEYDDRDLDSPHVESFAKGRRAHQDRVFRHAPMARRNWSASPGVKPAATLARRMACS